MPCTGHEKCRCRLETYKMVVDIKNRADAITLMNYMSTAVAISHMADYVMTRLDVKPEEILEN